MDASQFKRIFIPLSNNLYRIAIRLTCNIQSAEDLVQDTFLRLWTHRDNLPSDITPEGYAITTMRNLYYDTVRKRHLDESSKVAEEMHISSDTDIIHQLEVIDASHRIRNLINSLPDRQLQVIIMKDVEGLDTNEIKALTGLTDINIRTTLSRARTTIRKQFKNILDHGCK